MVEDPVEPARGRGARRPSVGGRPQRQLGAAPARDHGEPVRGGRAQHRGHLLGRGGRATRPGTTPSTRVERLRRRGRRAGVGDRPAGGVGRPRSCGHQKTSASPASCSGCGALVPARAPRRTGAAWGRPCRGWRSPSRVEGAAHQLHGVEVVLGVHPRHVRRLVDADAVLAGDRAAVLDAQVEDRAADLLGGLAGALDRVVEEHQRVQVAVAGVEDVGDPDARGARTARRSPGAPRAARCAG